MTSFLSDLGHLNRVTSFLSDQGHLNRVTPFLSDRGHLNKVTYFIFRQAHRRDFKNLIYTADVPQIDLVFKKTVGDERLSQGLMR